MKKKEIKSVFAIFGTFIISLTLSNSYINEIQTTHNFYNIGNINQKFNEGHYLNWKNETEKNEGNIIDSKVSIYLNPSVQTWNLYTNNLGTEAEYMHKIATEMHQILLKFDFIEVEGNFNEKGLSLENSIKESNSKKRDIHLALHSNAGGGFGSEIYTIKNEKFASYMLEGFTSQSKFYSRGVKNGKHLYEVKSIKATEVALFEILFHDNLKEATYIVNNYKYIAQNLSNSIVNYVLENYIKK